MVGRTIAFRGLSCLAKARQLDTVEKQPPICRMGCDGHVSGWNLAVRNQRQWWDGPSLFVVCHVSPRRDNLTRSKNSLRSVGWVVTGMLAGGTWPSATSANGGTDHRFSWSVMSRQGATT